MTETKWWELEKRPENREEMDAFEAKFSDHEAIDRAHDVLCELCKTGLRSWRMSIPYDARFDSDAAIELAFKVARRLLREKQESTPVDAHSRGVAGAGITEGSSDLDRPAPPSWRTRRLATPDGVVVEIRTEGRNETISEEAAEVLREEALAEATRGVSR